MGNALLCDDCLVRSKGLISRRPLTIRRPTVMVPSFQQQNSKDQFLNMPYHLRKSNVKMFLVVRAALGKKIRSPDSRRSTVAAPTFQQEIDGTQFLSRGHRAREWIETRAPAMGATFGPEIRRSDCPIAFEV